jgi:hypothetical protein
LQFFSFCPCNFAHLFSNLTCSPTLFPWIDIYYSLVGIPGLTQMWSSCSLTVRTLIFSTFSLVQFSLFLSSYLTNTSLDLWEELANYNRIWSLIWIF